MDLSTTYLGFTLPHPIVPGASPLADDLDSVRQLEDAGAPAIILPSLFEEQITREQMAEARDLESPNESFAEATSYFPSPDLFTLSADEYLEHLRRVKEAVRLPVFSSLNGSTTGGWLEYARMMQEAGADALELNMYRVATNADVSGAEVEHQMLDTLRAVKQSVTIPVAVKLSPFFSSLPHFARELDRAGVDGVVLFNRFYQPDINIQELAVAPTLHLSDSSELLLRLHWTAILSGRVKASLAVTGGVHTAVDVIKATMAGAFATQMVSALLRNGVTHLSRVRDELVEWLEKHEWHSLAEMRGNMSFLKVPDPEAYERGNYMTLLQGWRLP